ncbi:hypothetical protein J27TS7_19950 [Paenibacillus dendritiformis]|nr:hypothetical protein J27TS7_19950 [Paenibacillus dendritiformis]
MGMTGALGLECTVGSLWQRRSAAMPICLVAAMLVYLAADASVALGACSQWVELVYNKFERAGSWVSG